jgi:hypothetical protein
MSGKRLGIIPGDPMIRIIDELRNSMPQKIPGAGKARTFYSSIRRSEAEIRKSFWQRRDNPSGLTRPAFLIGNVRSGTSMIVFHIAKSWQVKLYNEDNPEAFDLWRLRNFRVIDNLLAKSHARVTLFKPILDTYRANVLLDNYPESRLIFAFRHYNDVINSSKKRFYDPDDGRFTPSPKVPDHDPRDPVTVWVSNDFADYADAPLNSETIAEVKNLWRPNLGQDSLIALRWLLTNRLYFDLNLFEDDRVLLVNYETTVTEPDREFRRIFRHLELDYQPHVIDGIFSSSVGRSSPPALDENIRVASDGLFDRLVQQAQNG